MPIAPKKFSPVITQAGKNEVTKLPNNMALQITHVGFGTGKYLPTDAAVALQSEVVRVPVSAGSSSGGMIQCYCDAMAPKGSSFFAYEIGFYCGSVLFAVFSTTGNALMYIADDAITTGAYSINLVDIPSGSVSVSVDPNAPLASVLVANHEAKQEPHPQYLNRARADALYDSKGSAANAANNAAQRLASHVEHADPHTNYLNQTRADARYDAKGLASQVGMDAATRLSEHVNHADPHSNYLNRSRADLLYDSRGTASQVDERLSAHANHADPHPQYLLPSEAQAAYAPKTHAHPINAPMPAQGLLGLGVGVSSIGIPPVIIPSAKASYVGFIHGSTHIENIGYQHHVSFGAYRTGVTGWWGGAYIALGVNSDSTPTEAYLFELSGKLTHSSGRAYTSNFDLPLVARRNSYTPAESTSINNASNEHGFDYNTSGSGVVGSFLSFGGFGDFNSSAKSSYQCQIQAGYATGRSIKFRTRNGDTDAWNEWRDIIHSYNLEAYLRSLVTPVIVNFAANPLAGSASAYTAMGGYGGGYRMIDDDKQYLIYAENGLFKIAMRTGDSGAYVPKFQIDQAGNASFSGSIVAENLKANWQSLNFDTFKTPGFYHYDGVIVGTKPNNSFNYRTIEMGVASRYSQIALPYDSDDMFFRRNFDTTFHPWRKLWHDGNLNKVSQLPNDAGYLSANPTSIQLSNVDAATAAGSYTAQWAGASSGVQTFNFNGSVGQVQLAFHYLGALQFRNKTDSAAWTAWKDVHTSASLTKLSQLANDIGVFPSGTRMPFNQSVAPVGWTQDTSDATNNRMLRVVNTAGGNWGGTHSPIINNIVPSHTHSFTTGGQSNTHSHAVNDSGHSHSGGETTQQNLVDGTKGAFVRLNYQSQSQTGVSLTGITLGNANADHTHSGTTNGNAGAENWQPRYIDMIICIKN